MLSLNFICGHWSCALVAGEAFPAEGKPLLLFVISPECFVSALHVSVGLVLSVGLDFVGAETIS